MCCLRWLPTLVGSSVARETARMSTLGIMVLLMPVLVAGFAAGLGFLLVWLDERAEKRKAREATGVSVE